MSQQLQITKIRNSIHIYDTDQEIWCSITEKLVSFWVCFSLASENPHKKVVIGSDLYLNIISSVSRFHLILTDSYNYAILFNILINPAMMNSWFWSQNILFFYLSQKISHTGIKSFPALILFLEIVCYFEIKSGGSNPYSHHFSHH